MCPEVPLSLSTYNLCTLPVLLMFADVLCKAEHQVFRAQNRGVRAVLFHCRHSKACNGIWP